MTGMWGGILGGTLVALITGVFTWLGRRSDAKATKEVAAIAQGVESRKVDLDDFREIQARNEAALKRADAAQARADKRIEQLEHSLQEEHRARVESDLRAEAAERRAARAEDRVDRLAATLAAHGQWDLLVLVEVRKANADFPDPPPLTVATD